MAAKGLAEETALNNAYGYLIEQASKGTEYAKLTARELKLLLKHAGEVSEKTMQNMLEWAKTMPEHFDRLESDSLKYLKDRWAKYQKNGTAEKIEQGIKEAIEKLPEGEELGLDGVKAVAEEAAESVKTKKLYRVMSDEEYQALISNGKFTSYDMAMEDKWFATTLEDAKKWAEYFYPNGIYRMVEIEVSAESLSNMYYNPCLDNIGPAYCSPLDILNDAIKSVKGVK